MLKAKGVAGRRHGDHGPEGHRLLGAARQDQGFGRRYAVRHHRRRADHADPEAGQGPAAQRAHHHHRRLQFARPADRSRPAMRPTARSTWCSSRPGSPRREESRTSPRSSWPSGTKQRYAVGGLTEGFRGWDGIYTIVEGIKAAGKAEPAAITKALWNVQGEGHQRRHRLHQAGARGQGERAERAERLPRQDRGRQGRQPRKF